MLNTLNLEEDKNSICKIAADHLTNYAISEWKYETVLKILIDHQLVIELIKNNLEKLGDLYLKECLDNYKDRRANSTLEDKEKIDSLRESIYKICTSSQIKKLLNVASHTRQLLDEDVINRVQQGQQDRQYQQNEQSSQATLLDNNLAYSL
ncbi:hypothetical protein G6F37_000841 [Rhizopus arrhizus]|nr:hypothetical protein G6F38_000216 [Rhizopus arrhizus]KAG1163841.1 hypothetical protein G6F37_000841 [Rhizopus arrhizus]